MTTAVAKSPWDMDSVVVLPAETGGFPAGGSAFPGGTYVLDYDDTGRAMGDDFDGPGMDQNIWDVLHNETTDGGRGLHSANNIKVANSVCTLNVTQASGSNAIMCAGAEGSAATRNYGWYQKPGTLVVWASRRPDGTDSGLKQIVLNWKDDNSWPPENDGEEHFPLDKAYVSKTTHDKSLGGGNNHQYPTKILDTCAGAIKWTGWHRWAMLNQGRDSWYWTDHNDGRGFVLDAHHVVPVGYAIGDMRFPGIGHHNKDGAHALSNPLYRFQLDFVALYKKESARVTNYVWDKTPLALTPPQPARITVTGIGRTQGEPIVLTDDAGNLMTKLSDRVNGDGTFSTTFQLAHAGSITGSLSARVGSSGLGMVIANPYDDTATYITADGVTANGNIYLCRFDGITGHQPADANNLGQVGTYWRRYL